jgi:hypothetical protein
MPELIEHIDAIARKKQRDVLSIRFYTTETVRSYDYRKDPERQRVIDWLNERSIAWQPCGQVANENMMQAYRGDIYVDVPFDVSDAQFQQLQVYLENPDGTMRHPSVTFEYYPLALAMKNAHHDEPGFWERWGNSL